MYFLKPISNDAQSARLVFSNHTKTMRLILGSIFASMAAVLQAAGGLLPGIGYFFSPLATAPILLCCMFSIRIGVMSYVLTILLLFILQPSELIVFPFTTGVLGLGIGASFYFFRLRISIIAVGAALLMIGIIILLYVLRFPVLGPVVSSSFSLVTTGCILFFSFLYSWFWVEISLIFFNRLKTSFT